MAKKKNETEMDPEIGKWEGEGGAPAPEATTTKTSPPNMVFTDPAMPLGDPDENTPVFIVTPTTSFGMRVMKALYRESDWAAWSNDEKDAIAKLMRNFEMFHEKANG